MAPIAMKLFFLVMLQWTGVSAHGKLTSPASRNEIWAGGPNCAHCLNGGGPCGDSPGSNAYLDHYEGAQTTWTAGSIVPITVVVTAHHRGHYEFRLCDQVLNSNVAAPDACLNRWVLERATPEEAGFTDCQSGDTRAACVPFDPNHPERWYLPPSGEISGTHTFYYKVPAGFQCTECTLQWHWWSANSCIPAGDYGCYKDILQSKGYWTGSKAAWWTVGAGTCNGPSGPNGHSGCGEQFWNCADVSVVSPNGPSPPVSTTSATTTTTAPVSTSSAVTSITSTTHGGTTGPSCEICGPSSTCIWTDGKCYPVAESACRSTAGTTWCGSGSGTTTTTSIATSISTTTIIITTTVMTTTTSTTVEYVDEFAPVDGGVDRACRGADSEDNDPSHYSVILSTSELHECKDHCRGTERCIGIEFNPEQGRCEVWTRLGGVGATRSAPGYYCFRYILASTCRATAASLAFEATDETCSSVCRMLPKDTWPCSNDGPCLCSSTDLLQKEIKQHRHLRAGRSSGNSWLQEASSMNSTCFSEEEEDVKL